MSIDGKNNGFMMLAAALAKRYGIAGDDADKFVGMMFDVMLEGIEQDGIVKVKGLGTFKLASVSARESVDVNTGERILIDSRNRISFVPDTVLRDRVNSPFAQFETVALNEGVDFSVIGNEDEPVSNEDEPVSNEDEPVSNENEPVSNENEPVSNEDEPVSNEDEPVSNEDEPVSNGGESIKNEDDESINNEDDESINNEDDATGKEYNPTKDVEGDADKVAAYETSDVSEGLTSSELSQVDEEQERNEDTSHPITIVANKLTDASNQLSTASSKLSDVSDKLTTASERLSDSSYRLSDSSQRLSDSSQHLSETSQQTAEPSESKKLSDALAIANDLRKQVFEMKEKSFSYTGENRKLKNVNIRLQHSMRRLRIWLWSLVAVVVILLVATGVEGYFLFSVHDSTPHRQLQHDGTKHESENGNFAGQMPRTTRSNDASYSQDKRQSDQSQLDNLNQPTNDDRSARDDSRSSSHPSTVKISSPGSSNEMPDGATKDKTNMNVQVKSATSKSSDYDSDPRVRTGAYRIVGVAQTVVARKGQTLASISRTYLGEGMECYVEALNGREVAEGEKVKIPKLELKKKRTSK